jgi:hypothetical protein
VLSQQPDLLQRFDHHTQRLGTVSNKFPIL